MQALIESISDILLQNGINEFAIGTNFNDLVPQDFKCTFDNEWQELYFENEMLFRDPVCWVGAFSSRPVWWRDIQSRNSVMRQARDFGIYGQKKPGLVIPIHHGNEKMVISIVGQNLRDATVEDINDLIISFTDQIFDPDALLLDISIQLSPQQKAMLWLKSQGYNYQEISRIMRLRLHSVNDGLERARKALGAHDSAHAVSNAIRLKYIS